MRVLQNSYHRQCLNYAQIAEYVYSSGASNADHKICLVVRNENSTMKINGFRGLLQFKGVVPHVVRLLSAGGIWTVNGELAYSALVKCRIEGVSQYLL